MQEQRVTIMVDEANFRGAARQFGRNLDWIAARQYLADEDEGRHLTEALVYYGLAPNMPAFKEKRNGQERFVHWLRKNGFYVVTKNGSPTEGGEYKANVDVLMAVDGLDFAVVTQPDIVVLVTGDADFAQFALTLRRRGIRVEVAAVEQTLGCELRAAANGIIDLAPLFNTFPARNGGNAGQIGTEEVFDS